VSFNEFWHVQAAETADKAFEALVDEAHYLEGHRPRGQAGNISDLLGVIEISEGAVALDRAKTLADEHGPGDAEYAYAIEVETAPGEPRTWFVFGKAHY